MTLASASQQPTAARSHRPGRFDPVGAVRMIQALASSGRFCSYVAYGRAGEHWFAGVGSDSESDQVTVTAREMRWRAGPERASSTIGPRPLRQLGDLLASWRSSDRRAYGYLAFELSHLIHGSAELDDGDRVLAHFVVPDIEIHWGRSGMTLSCDDEALAHGALATCKLAADRNPLDCAAVDLTGEAARRGYERSVAEVLGRIRHGDLRKAIISRKVDVPFPVDLPSTYVLGLRRNTPVRSFLFDCGGLAAAGFSPEIVATVSPTGEIRSQPLAGTRPLRKDPEQNRRWQQELCWDVKECYEHLISVRLVGEEIQVVCRPASVAVRDLLSVKERGTVQHLGSLVTGSLHDGLDAWDGLEALFPSVTASGIPKREALTVIRELEGDDRGLYAGAVCVASPDGSIDAALALRSIFQTGSGTWLQAGAGIVEGSDPASEFDETTNKLRSVADCLIPSGSEITVAFAGRATSDNERAIA